MITLPGYQVLAEVDESVNSIVYRGIRNSDNLPVILKVLKKEYPTLDEIRRYKQEYEIISHLNIDGVVKGYDLQKYENTPVIILEDFGGESLKKLMASVTFTLSESLQIAIKITLCLGQLHQQNIIHKDINPANIVFNLESGIIKLIDFDISTVLTRENSIIKNPNVLEGTLAYISPEQTGRMNRSLDYHTDYYSLGVTFYELFTGQLPCYANDAIELVHCHIAKQPVPPCEVNTEIPKAVSDIVMKLLEKTAEDRYQSAYGLKADLEECLAQLQRNGNISDFQIGRKDISDKFQIPQKIYGRESEIEGLIKTFERVIQGSSEMMLVSGYSGIGKTSLVQEIYKPITKQRGYFIAGKFDQFQRNIPYSAIVSAFSDLVRQLLTESEAQLCGWRDKLKAALGANGQVVIDLIPEVELIVGKQQSAVTLPPTEAQNRLKLVFQNFISVFAKVEHPLVIFLDDLQWADAASLKLIELLMTTATTGLFVIGAYRDNEVSAVHPLMLTLDEIQKAGAVVNHIFLEALDLANVNLLISDTLHCTPESSLPLAELVLERTKGNPFFTNEFLKSLYAENLIKFDYQQGGWLWSIEGIAARGFTDNVVELLADKIQKLPHTTQQALQLAACVGNQFDLDKLANVYKKSPQETAADLREAVAEGLILPLGNSGNVELVLIYRESFNDSLPITHYRLPEYKFAHDRIQQAAYSLIPASSKQAVHTQIGQLLLQNTPPSQREQKIFDILNQLNFGIELINVQSERDELAELNLIAGKKAKASAAYQPAFNYLNIGIELLNKEKPGFSSWETLYNLTLELYVEAAEAAYLSGNFEEMTRLAEVVLEEAQMLLDKVKIYEVKIQACIAQNKLLEAIKTALQVLKLLGVRLPEKPKKLNILLALLGTKLALVGKRIDDLIELPIMTDPIKLAAMRILSSIVTATYFAVPELMPLIVFKQVNLSLKHGNASESCHAYGVYGLILCGVVGDIDSGYQFGQLASSLVSRLNAENIKARTFGIVNGSVNHWKEHLNISLKHLLEAYQSGLETGDLEYAAYAVWSYSSFSYFMGKELTIVEREMATYSDTIDKFKQQTALNYYKMYHQVVLNLLGSSNNPSRLAGESYVEETMLPLHQRANDKTAICFLYINKLRLSYLFHEYAEAVENSAIVEKHLDAVAGLPEVPLFHFYDSLARLAVFHNFEKPEQKRILSKVTANQKKMKKWAHHCTMNYLHKFYLVEAERYRVIGEDANARDLYDRAISLAKENEFINEEALANELAAKFYLFRNKIKLAQFYMQEARYCYLRWGAIAKVKDLDARYSQLLHKKSEIATTETIAKTTNFSTTTGNSSSSALDFSTVMKASQSIASEIVLDKLLASLMKILIENAGATNGFLILPKDGNLLIEASSTVDSKEVAVLQSLPIDAGDNLPITVINYVERTRSDVVLSDAACEGVFTTDPYILSNKLKSVLCTTIVNQGNLIAILYLENNLTDGAFTPDRLEVLRMLSSQAAISLENALLYANLEQKVQERTRELKTKEASLAEAQKLAQLGSWELDLATQEITWTEEMFRIHGVNSNQDNPNLWQYFQLIHPDERTSIQERLEGIINTGETYEIEYRLLRTDACVRYISAKVQATLNESGKVIKLFGTLQDITERKLAEIALQQSEAQLRQTLQELKRTQSQLIQTEKMSSLGQMVAGVAHEINNPIGFIYGNLTPASQYVQDLVKLIRLYQESYPHPTDEILDTTEEIDLEFLVEDLQKLMASMKNGADRIRIIVLGLRNFSRLDESDMKPVDIHEGIDSTLLILQHRLHPTQAETMGKNVKITDIKVIKEYGKLPLVTCYASQMNQVFMNIFNNAIEALKEKKDSPIQNPQIRIRTEVTSLECVKITICDNGLGMTEDVLSKIFDPFFTTKPVGSGTGLGLSISYQIVVEKHGGQISCVSLPGEGAEFAIDLPIKPKK
ncbi:trifunctional serine/threonine-protein kinase/ATP-binding protein/sensor histidine kinase [Argonema antarcticum]|uniref:trifunctional serine/threonine-protein kinase/ATP-binding protein/sensor histidine kinase n=1 Tax=Argonema antarcticum TaxID=2942763 RepID=UPI0020126739|nr:ATP-binding sensor histidine kinase [Argonema antarcticum]MCL1469598.1 AAA family ATPase [Argonema antarcticum A004/B2]